VLARHLERLVDTEALTIVEVGSRLTAGELIKQEPYYSLARKRVLGFEPDAAALTTLQQAANRDVRFLPYALWREDAARTLYVARHPKCSSLYRPNSEVLKTFRGLDVALEVAQRPIETRRLDNVLRRETDWDAVDFLKADVQGAELDVLVGAGAYLQGLLALVVEIEFVELYHDQPLYWDVQRFLSERGFFFHHFLHLARACRAPEGDSGEPQVLAGDALYVRDLRDVEIARLPKLAILATLYGCHDLAAHVLRRMPGGEAALAAFAGEVTRRHRPSITSVVAAKLRAGRRLLRGPLRVVRAVEATWRP
jgi:protein O-GlcNAc transferase